MQNRSLPISVALLVGLSTAFLPSTPQPVEESVRADPIPVAVVDMAKLFEAYPGRETRNEALKALQSDLAQRADELREVGEAYEDDLEYLREGSIERFEKALQVEGVANSLRRLREFAKSALAQKNQELLLEIQQEIELGIAAYMRERVETGLPAVQVLLRMRSPVSEDDEFDVLGVELQRRETHDVIYAAPEVDLTAAINRFLQGWKPK